MNGFGRPGGRAKRDQTVALPRETANDEASKEQVKQLANCQE